jgi:hypothetical protein
MTVQPATPHMWWVWPNPIKVGTPLDSKSLNATSDVQGTFAYSPDAGSVFSQPGTYTLNATFTPTDTTDYVSGAQISTTITVTG